VDTVKVDVSLQEKLNRILDCTNLRAITAATESIESLYDKYIVPNDKRPKKDRPTKILSSVK